MLRLKMPHTATKAMERPNKLVKLKKKKKKKRKNPSSNAGEAGSTPDLRNKIPDATEQLNHNWKKAQEPQKRPRAAKIF